jgi:PAS domain S-box-containing protein
MDDERNFFRHLSDLLIQHQDDQDSSFYKHVKSWIEKNKYKESPPLNVQNLKKTQEIAKIGYFEWIIPSQKSVLSEEVYEFLNFGGAVTMSPSIDDLKHLVHPNDRSKVEACFSQIVKKETKLRLIFRIIDGKNSVKYLNCIAGYNKTENKIIGTLQDITEQMGMLEELKECKNHYNLLVDNTHDIITIYKNYEITYVSPCVEKVLGFSQQEYLSNQSFGLIHPDDRKKVLSLLERRKNIKATGKTTYIFRHKHKNGSYRWFELVVNSKPDETTGEIHSVAISRDITEQKKAEERLKESEYFFKTILANIWDTVFTTDANGNISFVCSNVKYIFGYSEMEFYNLKTVKNVLGIDIFKECELIRNGDLKDFELDVTDKFGKPHTILVDAKQVNLRDGEFLFTCRDITELKSIQRILTENEEKFKSYFHDDGIVKLIIDPQSGKILEASNEALNFYGYSREDLKTKYIQEINQLSPKEIEQEMQKAFQKVKKKFEFRHKIANGNIRDVLVFASPFNINDQPVLLSTIFDITESNEAFEKVYQLNDRMDFAMENNLMAWWEMELPSGKVMFNGRKAKMLGFKDDQFKTYHDFMKLVHPEDYEPTMNAMRAHLNGETELYRSEYRIKTKSKNYIWYRDVGKINEQREGFIKVVGISKNITEWKLAQQALAKSEEKLRITNNNILDVIWQMDKDAKFTYLSPSAEKLLGYSLPELIGKNVLEFIDERDRGDAVKNIKQRKAGLKGDKKITYEYRMIHKNGHAVDVEVSTNPMVDDKNQLTGFTGVTRDITDRKKAEQARRESEEKYKAMYMNAPLAYQSLNEDGKILDVNPQWTNTLGYNRDEVIDKWFGDFLHPDYEEHFKKNFPIFKEKGVIHDVQFRMRKNDGRYIDVSFEGCIGYTPEGKMKQTYCTFKDVTIENAIRKKLVESEEQFRKLIENLDEGIILVNPDGVIVQHNHAAVKILGGSESTLSGLEAQKFKYKTIHEDGSEFPTENHPAIITVKQGVSQNNVTMGIVNPQKTVTWIKINSEPIYLSDSKRAHALVSFTDISNLVEKEIKLKESNATKDKLFSILTHDLKNPFNALLGFTELLMQNYDRYDAGKHKKYIELLNRSAKSAHMLLENLLIWSRSQRDVISFDPALTPVKPIIDLIISQHESTLLSKSISVTQKITPPALSVYADVEMLKTILRNLLSNAIKFSEEEGEVEILCSETKETTLFMVKDYGKGIKKEDQKKLFRLDTKFTTPGTKQEKGTGLGLILCKDFVERHGGEIWVESKPGKGSTFRFSVPKQK